MYLSPCLAASFFAAFLVLPRPWPQQSPLTSALAAHTGVALLLSVTVSSKTHSIDKLCCCKRWLNRPRWPRVVVAIPIRGVSGGGVGGLGPVPVTACSSLLTPSGGRPCCSRTMRYASFTYGVKSLSSQAFVADSPWSLYKPPTYDWVRNQKKKGYFRALFLGRAEGDIESFMRCIPRRRRLCAWVEKINQESNV